MKRSVMTYMITFLLPLVAFNLCHGASLTMGQSVDVSGNIRLIDGQLCFSDLTCMSSAVLNDGSAIWGQITGLISNQTDLNNSLALKQDLSQKGIPSGYAALDSNSKLIVSNIPSMFYYTNSSPYYEPAYVPSWNTNQNWEILAPFDVYFNNSSIVDAHLEINFTDNVAVYADDVNGTYCNIGIFVDNNPAPYCTATFSGVYGYVNFDQKTIHCDIDYISTGVHHIIVKHRSDNCAYGSSPKGEFSTSRKLNIKLFRHGG